MTLDEGDPRLAGLLARPSPYGRGVLRRAGEHALLLGADAVGVEHVLGVLMEDEESAAHAAVRHAFADPETIAEEALALAPGLLVVASDSTRPFSPRAVRALRAARAAAAAERAAEVSVERVLAAAVLELPDEVSADLLAAGYAPPTPADERGPGSDPEDGDGTSDPVPEEGPLFRRFSGDAKRGLSQANRLAAAGGSRAIGPGHLVLACLRTDEELARRAGLAFLAARVALKGRLEDPSRPEARGLPPDEGLLAWLGRLPEEAGSLAMLAALHDPETVELGTILARHKVTAALLERAEAAFRDPE